MKINRLCSFANIDYEYGRDHENTELMWTNYKGQLLTKRGLRVLI